MGSEFKTEASQRQMQGNGQGAPLLLSFPGLPSPFHHLSGFGGIAEFDYTSPGDLQRSLFASLPQGGG